MTTVSLSFSAARDQDFLNFFFSQVQSTMRMFFFLREERFLLPPLFGDFSSFQFGQCRSLFSFFSPDRKAASFAFQTQQTFFLPLLSLAIPRAQQAVGLSFLPLLPLPSILDPAGRIGSFSWTVNRRSFPPPSTIFSA